MPTMSAYEDQTFTKLLRRLVICSLLLVLAATSCRRGGGGKPTGAGAPVSATSQPGANKMSIPWVLDGHIVKLTVTPVSHEKDVVKVHRSIDDPEIIRHFEKLVDDLRPRWRLFGSVVFSLLITHKFSATWDNGQQYDYRLSGDMMLSLHSWVYLNEDEVQFLNQLCQHMDKTKP